MGQLLFAIFINGLLNVVESETCSVYAFDGDSQLLIHGDSSTNCVLDQVNSWIASNRLILNAAKTRVMKFGLFHLVCPAIRIGEYEIEIVDKMKILGIILDDKLNFSYHIDNLYLDIYLPM